LHHDKQRLQTDLDSITMHSQCLEQELVAKSADYQHLQQDSRDRTIQLQLDQTMNEKEGLASRQGASSFARFVDRKTRERIS
jgi:hypothetical protein